MPKSSQKVLLSVLAFLVIFNSSLASIFVNQVRAANEWYAPSPQDFYTKVYDDKTPQEIFGERYTAAQVHWILLTFVTLPFTILPYDLGKCAVALDFGGCFAEVIKRLQPGGGTQGLAPPPQKSFGETFFSDRPLSAVSYFRNIAQRFHIVPQAQAQTGFGFTALDPVLPMWRAVRNFSYSLLVLVAVIMAFMIMFRVKLSPQVVISVQSALPKLVITIILITFSYAIAGLLVDLMYVAIGIFSVMGGSFLSFAGREVNSLTIFNYLIYGPQPIPGGVGFGIFGMIALYMLMFILVAGIIFYAQAGILGTLVAAAGLAITAIAAGIFAPVSTLLGLLAAFIFLAVVVALIFMVFKILWMLIKALATILLLTMFAPIYILAGALTPAIGFGTWFKSFVSNLAIFPLTGILFFMANYFLILALQLATRGIFTGDVFTTLQGIFFGAALADTITGTGAGWPPLLGWGSDSATSLVFLGTSLIILFTIPKAAELLQALITGKPFSFGAAIGEAMGPGVTAGKAWIGYRVGERLKGEQAVYADAHKGATMPKPGYISVLEVLGLYRGGR